MQQLVITDPDTQVILRTPTEVIIDCHMNKSILMYSECEGSTIHQTENGSPFAVDVRANNVTMQYLSFSERGIRLRFGASHCLVEGCSFIRDGRFIPAHDVVAVQIKPGTVGEECKNNTIKDNIFINYTDAIQLTDGAEDSGLPGATVAEGTLIQGNTIFATVAKPGIENALDFKMGGTKESPVMVIGNYITGYRSYPNPNNQNVQIFGYATTIHNYGDNIKFLCNQVTNCDIAYQIVRQYRDGQKYIPSFTFEGNSYQNVPMDVLSGAEEHQNYII